MNNKTNEISPQVYARAAGVLGLIIIFAGLFGEVFVRGPAIVSGDAATTASNIIASAYMFRLGFAAELIMLCCDIALAVILYVLLKPVNRNLALLAAFFRLALAAVSGLNLLNHFGVLLFLSDADYLLVFQPEQLQALALLTLKMHTWGYHISLVFFGFHMLLLGYLIFKSTYLPRLIGILIVVASACYLTNSFSNILFPVFAGGLFPFILLPCLIAELTLTLWLLIKGVNLDRWKAMQA